LATSSQLSLGSVTRSSSSSFGSGVVAWQPFTKVPGTDGHVSAAFASPSASSSATSLFGALFGTKLISEPLPGW
jgi:hypothetical protein